MVCELEHVDQMFVLMTTEYNMPRIRTLENSSGGAING